MERWIILAGAMLACGSTLANAQNTPRASDPVFARAQALVSDGNGVAGRALIDSVIAATPSGAPLYPQALFWRASLASNAADAESDYRHIVVDYPLAPQAEDALLRLAQLELARGDRDAALTHLQRIQRDYPRSKSLARASYWTARVLFEKNDVPSACAANAKALAQADSGEIELRNQIQYQGQRCPSVAAASAGTAPTSSTGSGQGLSTAASSTIAAVTPMTPPTSPTTVAAAAEKPRRADSAAKIVAPSQANDAKPSIVDPEKSVPKAAVEKSAAKTTPAKAAVSSTAGGYSIQVAAYNHKADAEKLVSTLTARGYAARVDGTVAPFRVRIGRYATNGEAEDALKRVKAKHMDGFVARVTER
jgi:cell division protein FtsN